MILREHYVDKHTGGQNGNLLELDYTASVIPETSTLNQLLLSQGTLFTITTPLGSVFPLLRKESIELEGAPGSSGQITVKIRYVQRPEDQDSGATVVTIGPASYPGAALASVTPATVTLPLLSHHWTLRVTQPFVEPLTELRCTGTCNNLSETQTTLLSGLSTTIVSVTTPQFGVLANMVKDEVDFEPLGIAGAENLLRVTLVWRSLTASGTSDFPLVEIRYTTGVTPGSCTLTRTLRGEAPSISQTLGQLFSYEELFQGRISNLDQHISATGLFSASLTALDARWEMAGAIIGSAPITSDSDAATNYSTRGYEWVFNRGGWPDLNPSAPQFLEGSTAVFWTFSDILGALSDAYMPASIPNLPDWTGLANADQTPGEIDLRGRDLATAIDMLLAQMGYTWTLRYDNSSGATLYPFNAPDTTITIPVGSVLSNSQVAAVASKSQTIQDAYGQTEVLSAPAICQCGFASQLSGDFAGMVPLTLRASNDSEFAYEYRPDFSGINSFFSFVPNRTDKGYPLHHELASRIPEGSPATGYAPPRASTDPTAPLLGLPTTSYFWVTWDDLEGSWRRVVGGVELRLDPPSILVRRRIAIYSATATQAVPKVEQMRPLDHAGFQIACTLAFLSDYRLSSIAGNIDDVPAPRIRVLTQREVVPAYANAWIGETFDSSDLNGYQTFSGLTTLVNAQDQLDALAAAAHASQTTSRVQSNVRVNYWPGGVGGAIGQTLAIDGTFFTGPEGIITEVTLRRNNTQSCILQATNQPLSAAQHRMAPVAAARHHFTSQLAVNS